jgi:serine/threonine protein kinase
MPPAPGDLVLDQYRLERPLASGAMGQVWAAKVNGTKEKVAVKLSFGPGAARAQREADALASLSHSGIVAHVAHGPISPDGFALVMALVDGVPLSKLLKASPPDVRGSLQLAAAVADALAHAHERGVVHRDVKASNLLIVREGKEQRPVLIDFGIGLVEGYGRVSSGDVVLGSVHTMPPEQMLGRPSGPRSDLYSLGALLFRMIAGRYPYHAASQVQVLAMHAHAAIPTLAERTERPLRVPEPLEPLLRRLLSKDPDDRLDALTLGQELRALADLPERAWVEVTPKLPSTPALAPAPPPPPPPPPPSTRLAVGVALLLVALGLGGLWWLS